MVSASIYKPLTALWDGFTHRVGSSETSMWNQDWLKSGPLCNVVDYFHISDSHLCIKDIWKPDSWEHCNLATQMSGEIKDPSSNVTPVQALQLKLLKFE